MSALKVSVISAKRQQRGFCTLVVSWKYRLTTGPRCGGVEAVKDYPSRAKAADAGERMARKLNKVLNND